MAASSPKLNTSVASHHTTNSARQISHSNIDGTHATRYSRRDPESGEEDFVIARAVDRFSFLLVFSSLNSAMYNTQSCVTTTSSWQLHFIWFGCFPNSYIIHNRSPEWPFMWVFFLLGVLVEFLIYLMFSSAIYDDDTKGHDNRYLETVKVPERFSNSFDTKTPKGPITPHSTAHTS